MEKPEFFSDPLHMNMDGSREFSVALANELVKLLGRGSRGRGEMLFNTFPFFVFLVTVLTLFYLVPRALRKYVLLAASYLLLHDWNPRLGARCSLG
ncbi:MAG: hypothetical protein R2748_28265 [Bryobacterales bacterium]